MSYLSYSIEKKLKKSVAIEKKTELQVSINNSCSSIFFFDEKQQKISLIIKKLLLNFLVFFSKRLINKKKNIKNLLLFLKFYRYYNTFFFNNKLFFYKKYFSKKNYNIPYLSNFFLRTRQIRLNPCLYRLKDKKIVFYKKNIWNKNKKFRKKNILIFNKKFFKSYTSTRFNRFIVDYLLSFFKFKKMKKLRFFRKKFVNVLHKRFYYLFLFKYFIFSSPKKRFNKNKRRLISFNLKYKTYAKIFVNKKFFVYRRRKKWRRVYFTRKRRRFFFRGLVFSLNSNSFNKIFFNKFKKKASYGTYTICDYLQLFLENLAKKHSKDKNFYLRAIAEGRIGKKHYVNLFYFFKWKPKTFHFHFLSILKKYKNLKKILFTSILFRFFYKKIFWIKKKSSKTFLLHFYNNFFFNKNFMLFNSFFKAKFGFVKSKKLKKRKRLKRRKFTVYVKKIRRRIIKARIKRKVLRLFIILLFFRLMRKHKNPAKVFALKNSLCLSKIKKIRVNLLSSILLGNDPLYFKNSNSLFFFDIINFKKNLKVICLLKKINF